MKAFISVVLDEPSRALLLNALEPCYGRVFAHHLTLGYNPDSLAPWEALESTTVDLEVYEECVDNDIQAARVRVPSGVVCGNTHPHITISAREGIAPVRSNAMLASPTSSLKVGPLLLRGTLTIERR